MGARSLEPQVIETLIRNKVLALTNRKLVREIEKREQKDRLEITTITNNYDNIVNWLEHKREG